MSDGRGNFLKHRPPLLREILWKRGFRSDEEAERFLTPKLADIPSPHDCLLDLREAIQILLRAREKQEQIVVYGDYDVDGSTSTALLVRCLKALGFRISYFIPHRVDDGYGVTASGVSKLLVRFPDAKVIVTCDNGIASHEGVALLKQKGLAVIVTDHHEVPKERVSADAVLNPKQAHCGYPDKKLAGVGVAFLLLMGLRRALQAAQFSLVQYLDLVAIGTICDVASLTGVNRIFARFGLERMKSTSIPAFKIFGQRLKADDRPFTTRDAGFFIGPRLNASGRIGDPELGARTLLEDDMTVVQGLVDEMEAQNTKRKSLQEQMLKVALARTVKMISANPQKKALVIGDTSFHLGIVGLLASKISEALVRPTCVLTRIDDEHELAFHGHESNLWKGSLRAPLGFHLAQALDEIRRLAPGLLVSGGGHAQAAGIAVRENRREEFEALFEQVISAQKIQEVGVEYDAEFESLEGFEEIPSLMEPTGQGNPPVSVLVRGFEFESYRAMKEIHLKFWGNKCGKRLSVLQFQSPWVKIMSGFERGKSSLDFVAELSENRWQGKVEVELILRDLLSAETRGVRLNVRDGRQKTENAISAGQGLS